MKMRNETREENNSMIASGKTQQTKRDAGVLSFDSVSGTGSMSSAEYSAREQSIQDYRICHSLLLKFQPNSPTPAITPIGVSLCPTVFPRSLWDQAHALQRTMNLTYMKSAIHEEWLESVLQDLISNDMFTQMLWTIYLQAKGNGFVQDLTMGVFRSDYMIHTGEATTNQVESKGDRNLEQNCNIRLGQIEFNTMAVAGGSHATRVAEMHRHIESSSSMTEDSSLKELPPNSAIDDVAKALAEAHRLYGRPRSLTRGLARTAILMVVQPNNINIADERPIEYALQSMQPPIRCYRAIFPSQIHELCRLGPNRELLYNVAPLNGGGEKDAFIEISVVYWRSGHEPRDYTGLFRDVDRRAIEPNEKPSKSSIKTIIAGLKPSKRGFESLERKPPFLEPTLKSFTPGIKARVLLESSAAIQCPNVLTHLTTYKMVQAALASPTALTNFVENEADRTSIEKTFLPMYTFTTAPAEFKTIINDESEVRNWILKPCLEGGGNNIHGRDIPKFLEGLSEMQWKHYILQKRVTPVVQKNILIGPQGVYASEDDAGRVSGADCVSEVGVFGTAIWRRNVAGKKSDKVTVSTAETTSFNGGDGIEGGKESTGGIEVLWNEKAGWSLKTKALAVKEMSVVKGYGCFDAPQLVDDEDFCVTYGEIGEED